jgi:hypothetical protein
MGVGVMPKMKIKNVKISPSLKIHKFLFDEHE